MEHYVRVQRAILYIEDRLREPIGLPELAAEAGFSVYHFQRLFHAVTGYTVQGYIRGRRLAMAAAELRETERTVLEIAVACEYGSQEAFTRAFAAAYGLPPAQYRRTPTERPDLAPIELTRLGGNMRGGLNMTRPDNVERPSVKLMGYTYPTSLNSETYFEEIPGFYGHFGRNGLYLRIPNRVRPDHAYGVGHSYRDDGGFDFLIGEEVSAFAEPEPGFACLELPEGRYAAFRTDGAPELGQNVWKYIYGTWLPESGYERREGPDFEVTDVPNSSPGRLRMTVYIPIR